MKRKEKNKQGRSSNDALFTKKGLSGNKGRNYRQTDKSKVQQGFRNMYGSTRDKSVRNKGPKCFDAFILVTSQNVVQ